jgi:hypothetical protein
MRITSRGAGSLTRAGCRTGPAAATGCPPCSFKEQNALPVAAGRRRPARCGSRGGRTSALNTGDMAEQISLFGVGVGGAFLLVALAFAAAAPRRRADALAGGRASSRRPARRALKHHHTALSRAGSIKPHPDAIQLVLALQQQGHRPKVSGGRPGCPPSPTAAHRGNVISKQATTRNMPYEQGGPGVVDPGVCLRRACESMPRALERQQYGT